MNGLKGTGNMERLCKWHKYSHGVYFFIGMPLSFLLGQNFHDYSQYWIFLVFYLFIFFASNILFFIITKISSSRNRKQ